MKVMKLPECVLRHTQLIIVPGEALLSEGSNVNSTAQWAACVHMLEEIKRETVFLMNQDL